MQGQYHNYTLATKTIYSSADLEREKTHENRSCFHLAANLYNYFDPCYRSASVVLNLSLFGAVCRRRVLFLSRTQLHDTQVGLSRSKPCMYVLC